ncbi:hypothetical protein [Nocardia asiatica]|uniref:hypothetical protein n=1 Tax=Nocardia asiatica TaxID=209252 RepID=UPI0024559640|nr:hypothetical protein [Nocardia asiatica]
MPMSASSPQFVGPEADGDSVYTAQQYVLNSDLVEQIESQTLIDEGFCYDDPNGRPVADTKQLQHAVLQVMEKRHVVANNRELAKNAVTKFELYSEILPNGPGVKTLPESPEHAEVHQRLMRKVWGFANTGQSGYVQKNIAPTGMILCEASVARTKINEETRKREPGTEIGRFLTSDPQLILKYFTAPAGSAFAKAARKLENQLGLVTSRQPELAMPVARQIGVVVKQAVAAIPHADVRQAGALTAGANDEAASA